MVTAGRRAAARTESAGRSIAASARAARHWVVERAKGTDLGLMNRARTAGGRPSAKRGGGLGRRVGEIASSLHGRGFILWAAALVTGLVCVWQHVHSNELALKIEALRSVREAVETEIGLLEMECAELSRRERVEEYASGRLGMRYPGAGEVIWLRPSDSGRLAERQEDYVEGEAPRDAQG